MVSDVGCFYSEEFTHFAETLVIMLALRCLLVGSAIVVYASALPAGHTRRATRLSGVNALDLEGYVNDTHYIIVLRGLLSYHGFIL